LIWGSAFTAQQVVSAHVGPFLVLGIRFLGAMLLLIPVVRFRLLIPRRLWWKISLAGLFLFLGAALQQAAIAMTSVGNAGFITGMYVVFTPLLMALVWRQRLRWNVWLSVGIVSVGLYFLTANGASGFGFGDVLLLACALFFALQMILTDQLVREIDPLQMAIGEFFVCGLLGLVFSFIFESNSMAGIFDARWGLIYVTVFSSGVAYTLQGVAQKIATPTDAAIFLSMESVFAALTGAVVLAERFTPVQVLGGGLMFAAMILSQITFFPSKLNSEARQVSGN
ncbi:MAG: DMT family transporter, partial [Anaerolineaceae bacterium]|nr:DMT family transporter [Anaerolineaceae bacterium]